MSSTIISYSEAKMDRKTREIKLHKIVAKEYDNVREKNPIGRFYSLSWINNMLNDIPRDKRLKILDVGCGTGIAYEVISNEFNSFGYVGIDLSDDMISVGRSRYPGATLNVMDCEKLKFKDSSFDIVFARSILHHVPHPDIAASEMIRVVKKDGMIIVSEPHRNFMTSLPREISKSLTGHFDKDHTNFTMKEIVNMFRESSMTILKREYFGYIAYPFAFPDIINISRIIPKNLFKKMYKADLHISKCPLLNRLSWHIILKIMK